MARVERKPAENLAFVGILVQFAAGLVYLWLTRVSGAASVRLLAWQAFICVPVWIITLVRLRQGRLAEEEQLEWDRLQAERAAGGAREDLFDADELQAFSARNRLRVVEKVLFRALSIFLILAFATIVTVTVFRFIATYQSVVSVKQAPGAAALEAFKGIAGERKLTGDEDRALLTAAFLVVVGFVQLLVAMYAAGMAREKTWRHLRASSSFMMVTTILSWLCAGAVLAGLYGVPDINIALAHFIVIIQGLAAFEILINLILGFYRPHVAGVEYRPSFDSRLLGLISEPGGILKTVATTLDYQFGFKVSQTWFYQMIEQMIAPVILFFLFVLYALTSFVIIGPNERGILERFGTYKRVVQPGCAWKWPWPIDSVYRFPVDETKRIVFGHEGEETHEGAEKILWTEKHREVELETMVSDKRVAKSGAGFPGSLLVAPLIVDYRIRTDGENGDDNVCQWYYNCAAPEELMEALCCREQQVYFASADFDDVLGPGRAAVAKALQARIQVAADEAKLGVEILSVGFPAIHPPAGGKEGDATTQLPESFRLRVKALLRMKIDILNAEKEAYTVRTAAQIKANRLTTDARIAYSRSIHEKEAATKLFEAMQAAYSDSAMEVFKIRELYKTIEGWQTMRKYMVSVGSVDRVNTWIDLKEDIKSDLSLVEFKQVEVGDQNDPNARYEQKSN